MLDEHLHHLPDDGVKAYGQPPMEPFAFARPRKFAWMQMAAMAVAMALSTTRGSGMLFIRWLRERGDLYDLNGGPVAKQVLIDRGLFEVVWAVHGGKPRPTTKLTGRGMVHYAKALGVRPPGPAPQGLLPGL